MVPAKTHTDSIRLQPPPKRRPYSATPSLEDVLEGTLQASERDRLDERRPILRAAIRQLERAEDYIAAASYLELGDPALQLALDGLRQDLEGLRLQLAERRSGELR